MNKKEIGEIKKQFTPDNCAITRLCGCYVDAEKNRVSEIKDAFLSLPEDEMFKYFDIFKKALSGSLGRNLMNLEFPLAAEREGGTQEFLLQLRASRLTDDALLSEFYDRVIASYDCTDHYLILVLHAAYDIPGKSSDGLEMFDASDEVYEHLLCCVCPVKLSKAGLAYDAAENSFHNRIRDWLVEMPDAAFLFPAFNDRSTDIHGLLYYTKKPENLHDNLIDQLLGCALPLSAPDQKETFRTIVETALGEDCDLEAVKTIHEKLSEMAEVKKDDPEPFTLDKADLKALIAETGADSRALTDFDACYEACAGTDAPLTAANVAGTRKFEVKTPDVVVTVNPERADLVRTQVIDGHTFLVIPVDEHLEVNGITVRALPRGAESPAENNDGEF